MAKPVSLATEGCLVSTHGLSNAELNGLQGAVVGSQGERIIVSLGDAGQKALRPDNLEMDRTYGMIVFLCNGAALLASLVYMLTIALQPTVGNIAFRLCLVMHIAHYAYLVRNMGVSHLSLSGIKAVAATASGQLLVWVLAFLILGESCYFLVGALACYGLISMAKVHSAATDAGLYYVPIFFPLRSFLSTVESGLQKSRGLMATYDATYPPTTVAEPRRPTPPAHYLEIAGVCLELFVGVQQLFQVVLSATQSFIMLVICWRYLGYRYKLPRNRTVRTVLNKAREKLAGYIPSFMQASFKTATDYVWGEPLAP